MKYLYVPIASREFKTTKSSNILVYYMWVNTFLVADKSYVKKY